MTREERELSVIYLEEIKEKYIEGEGYERHPLPEYYAIETAIKALNKEPCEDCISRQAVFDAMRKNHRSRGRDIDGDYVEGNYSEHLHDDIASLPPVTPQPKMGRWIHNKCDKCGASRPPLFDNYCPNCGQPKMQEIEE